MSGESGMLKSLSAIILYQTKFNYLFIFVPMELFLCLIRRVHSSKPDSCLVPTVSSMCGELVIR